MTARFLVKALLRVAAAGAAISSLLYRYYSPSDAQLANQLVAFSVSLNLLVWVGVLVAYTKQQSNRQREFLKRRGIPGVDGYYDLAEQTYLPGFITMIVVVLVALGFGIVRSLLGR